MRREEKGGFVYSSKVGGVGILISFKVPVFPNTRNFAAICCMRAGVWKEREGNLSCVSKLLCLYPMCIPVFPVSFPLNSLTSGS